MCCAGMSAHFSILNWDTPGPMTRFPSMSHGTVCHSVLVKELFFRLPGGRRASRCHSRLWTVNQEVALPQNRRLGTPENGNLRCSNFPLILFGQLCLCICVLTVHLLFYSSLYLYSKHLCTQKGHLVILPLICFLYSKCTQCVNYFLILFVFSSALILVSGCKK